MLRGSTEPGQLFGGPALCARSAASPVRFHLIKLKSLSPGSPLTGRDGLSWSKSFHQWSILHLVHLHLSDNISDTQIGASTQSSPWYATWFHPALDQVTANQEYIFSSELDLCICTSPMRTLLPRRALSPARPTSRVMGTSAKVSDTRSF